MRQAVESFEEGSELHLVGDLASLRALLREKSATIVMLDLTMPGTSGFSGLVAIRAEFPDIPVIVVSAHEEALTVKKCIELGASGFIPKSSSMAEIHAGMEAVRQGEIWAPEKFDLEEGMDDETSDLIARLQSLTPQQTRVLTMLGEGLLNKQIAFELGVSEATVKAHVSAVLLKLNVDSRTQAVIIMNKINSGTQDSKLAGAE